MEKSLVIIKPDAVRKKIIGEIISRIEREDLTIEKLKMAKIDRKLACEHYCEHKDKNFFRVFVDFDGRVLVYEKDELNEISLAYALSVHKAQGSEYQAVVIPLMTQHYIMLQRNLFYTALTRAKRLCVIVGTYKALHIAIKNNKPILRNTRLKDRLILWGEKLN